MLIRIAETGRGALDKFLPGPGATCPHLRAVQVKFCMAPASSATFCNFSASKYVSVIKAEAQFTHSSGVEFTRRSGIFSFAGASGRLDLAAKSRHGDAHVPGNLQSCRAELA